MTRTDVSDFAVEVRELAARFPDARSATIPALRIAQERHGWLPPEAFEAELGVRAGETTADGAVTFRTVECLGGCGYATVVAIDHRYREHVNADDVPSIVETIRAR